MNARDNSTRYHPEFVLHEIRVPGHLEDRWADWLQGLTFTHDGDGTTTLTGPLADQTALNGVVNTSRDLALPLVSVRRVCPDAEKAIR
jgi:hypothetical protein